MYCGGLYRWVGDVGGLNEAAERLAYHSRKHGFGPFQTISVALKGESYVARGDVDEGVHLLRQSIPRMQTDRSGLYSGAAAIALVEGLAAQGRIADALSSVQALIDEGAREGESWESPELLRIRGELRSQSGDQQGAERDLLAAIDLSERHSALSWTLRAVTSRVRLAGRSAPESVSELRLTYARFLEGFDTADLRAARGMLQELPFADLSCGLDLQQRLTTAHNP
jgi:hypothetical protein